MAYQSFEDWRDSDDGPQYHEVYESDLRNAFNAGRGSREAALAFNEGTMFKVRHILYHNIGLSDQQITDVISVMQNEGILFRERAGYHAVTEKALMEVIDTYTLGMYRPSVIKLRNKIKELYNG